MQKKDIRKIVDLQLTKLEARLADEGYQLVVTDAAKQRLADEGCRIRSMYARPPKRVIQQRLQNELANAILAGEFAEGTTITVDDQHGEFTFTGT
ncbi:MAG: hypothetical protein U0872_01790 [Planctomycetaceae bacterium]